MKRLILTIILSLSLPLAAQAGNGNGKSKGHGHAAVEDNDSGNGNHHYNGDDSRHSHGPSIVYHDRVVIEDYLNRHGGPKHCPPGLAKKHNGCLPPGQAKKYRIGERLPPDVVYVPVPHDLVVMIGPPPRGYRYVQVDKDVLLIGEATRKVIDAVELLSAVGN